jgi:hypothetical protein
MFRTSGTCMLGSLVMVFAMAGSAFAQSVDTSRWNDYLDFAYVYVSADANALKERLAQYGLDSGMTLAEYIAVETVYEPEEDAPVDEDRTRRLAIAHLLQYLAVREPQALAHGVELVSEFEGQAGRHENLYWYHYVMAHRSLEKGSATEFSRHMLGIWLDVVVPLESPYETLQALSLSQSVNSGFVSALPYVFENSARMILLRSQEMGLHRDLDPLAAIVRMLAQGRVGAHPDVIPTEASSKDYLNRIISRLDGPESDGGSLTFTLVLFEAGKYHDQARGLLASEGLSDDTIKAIGVASGAYQTAFGLADTLQGHAAVQTRVLRQLGEVWAAKQRLGVDPYVEMPFTIEGAIAVYRDLHSAGMKEDGDGWQKEGFKRTGYESYVLAMQELWEEIQEASLNAADYYLTRSMSEPMQADTHVRNAARTYTRYLSFFEEFATEEGVEYVPDSAYFAAYEASKGYGDAFLVYSSKSASASEIQYAVERYLQALRIFPFDRKVWPALAGALERQGRSNQFLALSRPIADRVVRSRYIDAWIQDREEGSEQIEILRRAMSDELAIMYLGFAEDTEIDELEASLTELRDRRNAMEKRLMLLASGRRPAAEGAAPPAAPAVAGEYTVVERARIQREMEEAKLLLDKLDKQLMSRSRALPLFKATLETDDLIPEMRAQRTHSVHTLLRRLYYESHAKQLEETGR